MPEKAKDSRVCVDGRDNGMGTRSPVRRCAKVQGPGREGMEREGKRLKRRRQFAVG